MVAFHWPHARRIGLDNQFLTEYLADHINDFVHGYRDAGGGVYGDYAGSSIQEAFDRCSCGITCWDQIPFREQISQLERSCRSFSHLLEDLRQNVRVCFARPIKVEESPDHK